MNKSKYAIALMACCIVAVAGCAGKTAGNTAQQTADEAKEITFDADSAYSFVARQCAFGERVPNTDAHSECGDWIALRLRQCGATVTEQRADLKAFDGTLLHARNIVGEFYPEKKRRVLLVAHWDCRPWADSDPNPDNRRKPVMGANDGASGVGVLLEMARLLKNNEPAVGIDILLVDAEDWGDDNGDNPDSWALGAQHWVRTPHREGYTRPEYAILLDMVGDANATFLREYFSQQYAPRRGQPRVGCRQPSGLRQLLCKRQRRRHNRRPPGNQQCRNPVYRHHRPEDGLSDGILPAVAHNRRHDDPYRPPSAEGCRTDSRKPFA